MKDRVLTDGAVVPEFMLTWRNPGCSAPLACTGCVAHLAFALREESGSCQRLQGAGALPPGSCRCVPRMPDTIPVRKTQRG